jgi:hypothetical protein
MINLIIQDLALIVGDASGDGACKYVFSTIERNGKVEYYKARH